MKIVFWSPMHGQAGTTSNLLVISILTGLLYKKKTLITQTQFNYNNLEAPLVSYNTKNNKSTAFFQGVGIDSLIRSFKAAKPDFETIDNCCISFPNTNLMLLPGTIKNNREAFEEDMSVLASKIFKDVEEFVDVIFLDVCSGSNPLSKQLMKEADLTVINLSHNLNVIENFLAEQPVVAEEKLFYLFGNYDSRSKYNINNLRRKYKVINSKNSGVIPTNVAFMDSQIDGKVISFLRNNIRSTKTDDNYYFMLKAKSSAEKILNLSGLCKTINIEE